MKRILITGANKGIGLAIATAILDEHGDTFAILGSRNPDRGRAAVDELCKQHPNWAQRVATIELDVTDSGSVERAAAEVASKYASSPTPLFAVVNNAGIGTGDMASVLEVNTRGLRRVCEAFWRLVDPAQGRIVNITSAAGPNFVHGCSPERQRLFLDPEVTWPALQAVMDECIAIERGHHAFASEGLGDGSAYGLSKACANSYTMLFAREHPALRVNACTPGFIETDMTRRYAQQQGKTPADLGMKPPAAGARAAMFLLFGDPPANGRYYGSDAQRSPLDRYRAPGDPPYAGA